MGPENQNNHRRTGHRYERAAEDYLVRKGYLILERNWQAGHKEIDLIARKDNCVVFIEVKGSRTKQYGHPAERVDISKRRNLVAAAEKYITDKNLTGLDFRVDVITFHEGNFEHYENAFFVEE
ncbi:MAG: YraN family protein, partial [Candidatus Zixiibacteriota bacterium]